ncbi:hypothetical protein AVEN_23429-1 [Araneus ventricosus]|uniref:Uncharacterized protein n=1 Tax=Araneus ventricosus TaxID=182803 RepID=A0A4Y2E6Y9_ARAVE|nr:hypothetical protein AVEN_23429-1 [Araneus ventricosus]
MHELILEAKRKPNFNVVVTRSQTHKIDPSQSLEKKEEAVPPKEPAAVVEGDATPLSLPPAVREDGRLVEVASYRARTEDVRLCKRVF